MRTPSSPMLAAGGFVLAATAAVFVAVSPAGSALSARSIVTADAELPEREVAAAQVGEVSEAFLTEDTTPRPYLVAGVPDGDPDLLPAHVVAAEADAVEEAPEPQPDPEPAPASNTWRGIASWYGDAFAGRKTASGSTFDPNQLTAAHRTLPFGTQVRVTFEATGQSVVVTITDRGPYAGNREIDLSRAAADAIGLRSRGTGMVTLQVV